MKHNIKQLTDMHVSDSKQHITGDVAEHLINEARSMENGYYFYLTDEEIEQFESDESIKQDLIYEIEDWIVENYTSPKFFIIDASSNDDGLVFVMDEDGETGHVNENCISFDTEKEAQDLIDRKGWGEWAAVIEL